MKIRETFFFTRSVLTALTLPLLKIRVMTEKKLSNFLKKPDPILRPDEAFKFSISSSSQAVIIEQLRKHQLVISSCIKEKDFAFVDFKLKEIKYLNDLLKEESIKQIYEECLKTITKSVNLQYKES